MVKAGCHCPVDGALHLYFPYASCILWLWETLCNFNHNPQEFFFIALTEVESAKTIFSEIKCEKDDWRHTYLYS